MSSESSKSLYKGNAEPPTRWLKIFGQRGTFGGPLQVLTFAIFIFVLSQAIAVFLVALGYGFTHSNLKPSQALDQSAGLQFAFIAIAEFLAVWLTFKLLKIRRLKKASIGLGRQPKWSDLKWAGLGFAAFYVFWIVVAIVINLISPDVDLGKQDVGFTSLNSLADWALAFVGLVILPPLAEETLVRGYLYSGLRTSLRFLPAMLITSSLFGLAHLQGGPGFFNIWGAAIDTFVLSLVLVYLRERTGALYACILVHASNNLIAFIIHFHG